MTHSVENTITHSEEETTTIYAALEVSNRSWILGLGDPRDASRTGLHKLLPQDVDGLLEKIGRARCAVVSGPVRVLLTYEAGYEGFWLARRLEGEDLEVVICDPASLEVVRRKKKAKTDRIDARKMVRALRAWDGGDRDALAPVRVPSVEEEDAKRLLRRRERLVNERTRITNTVGGLLRLHGVSGEALKTGGLRERLDTLETGYGTLLLPGIRAEILGLLDRLDLVWGELREVEAEKVARLTASKATLEAHGATPAVTPDPEAGEIASDPDEPAGAVPKHAHCAATLVRLHGIGINDALLLSTELFYRDFRNRRELASMAGLVPVPWASGGVDHDQGISKAGNSMLRKHLVQMAWRWLQYQPGSALSKWYREYVSARDGRARKRAIVALARKLLVALWRFATTGLVPEGAVLSKA